MTAMDLQDAQLSPLAEGSREQACHLLLPQHPTPLLTLVDVLSLSLLLIPLVLP